MSFSPFRGTAVKVLPTVLDNGAKLKLSIITDDSTKAEVGLFAHG